MSGPPRLLKYLRREHLDAVLHGGRFRIGTLHAFRDIERYGATIGDGEEGKRTTFLTSALPIEFDLLSADDPRAAHARKVIQGWDQFPEGSTLKIRMELGSRLELYTDSPDAYVRGGRVC